MKLGIFALLMFLGTTAFGEGTVTNWKDSFSSKVVSVQTTALNNGEFMVEIKGKSSGNGAEVFYMIPVKTYADASSLARDAKGSARINCGNLDKQAIHKDVPVCNFISVYH